MPRAISYTSVEIDRLQILGPDTDIGLIANYVVVTDDADNPRIAKSVNLTDALLPTHKDQLGVIMRRVEAYLAQRELNE